MASRRRAPRATRAGPDLGRAHNAPRITLAVRDAFYTPPARKLDTGFPIIITDQDYPLPTRWQYWDGNTWQVWTPGGPVPGPSA